MILFNRVSSRFKCRPVDTNIATPVHQDVSEAETKACRNRTMSSECAQPKLCSTFASVQSEHSHGFAVVSTLLHADSKTVYIAYAPTNLSTVFAILLGFLQFYSDKVEFFSMTCATSTKNIVAYLHAFVSTYQIDLLYFFI